MVFYFSNLSKMMSYNVLEGRMMEIFYNRKLNIQFFQELGLKNVVISRFLTTASNIFHNPIEKNKQMIKILQESYLNLGG